MKVKIVEKCVRVKGSKVKGEQFNAFGHACRNFYCKNAPKSPRLWRQWLQLSRLPLVAPFFIKLNAVNDQCDSKYSKNDAQGQGQILEEVTGEANAGNVLAQVAVNLGDKFVDHLFTDRHNNNLLFDADNKNSGDYVGSVGGNRINRGYTTFDKLSNNNDRVKRFMDS